MSWHKVPKAKGGGYEVRWRQGNRQRSRTFRRRGDAIAFDDDIKRRRRLGTLADLDAGTELLSDFAQEWWIRSARQRLKASTLQRYEELWDLHVLSRLGDYQLRELRPGLIQDELVGAMAAKGVGPATIKKALYILQSVLRYAVVRDRLPYNPVEQVDRPRQRRRAVKPLAPATIERTIAQLKPRDAMLVELMGYQGLRPGEALALTDDSVRERTLLVESNIALGEETSTKTSRIRTVRLLAPVARDLAAYRLQQDRPRGCRLLFPRPDGDPWRDTDYRNWRRRTWKPAIRVALGLGKKAPTPRPYDLRHSFVSLLIQEGRTIVEVADQAGHSAEECARTYAHVFEEFEGAGRKSAEDLILEARAELERRAV